ncbi:MAG: hypothetical protein V2A62_03180 [Candidatus Woesearchaeota archaeon]
MTKVNIGKRVDYPTLEKALVEAAEEIGWKAKVKDVSEEGYRLGSVEETSKYDHTVLHLRGILLPAMKVYLSNKEPTEYFNVWTGFPFGVALKGEVKKYLSAVSKHLQS